MNHRRGEEQKAPPAGWLLVLISTAAEGSFRSFGISCRGQSEHIILDKTEGSESNSERHFNDLEGFQQPAL